MWWIDGISLHYDLLTMDLQFNDDGTLPQEDQNAIQQQLKCQIICDVTLYVTSHHM